MARMHPCERVGIDFVETAPHRYANSVDLAVTPDGLLVAVTAGGLVVRGGDALVGSGHRAAGRRAEAAWLGTVVRPGAARCRHRRLGGRDQRGRKTGPHELQEPVLEQAHALDGWHLERLG